MPSPVYLWHQRHGKYVFCHFPDIFCSAGEALLAGILEEPKQRGVNEIALRFH